MRGRRSAAPNPRRTRFGRSWWGTAWIRALEERARLDPNRLGRGRTYARAGQVREMVVQPGRISAQVRGRRANPYEVLVRVRPFTGEEWDLVLGAIGASASHVAAMLDGDMLPGLVEDLEARGVQLLPAAGEVVPACSCPDWANPCKHAAAVCYLMATRLDEDPFELLALRGRARDDVLATLRRLRSGGVARPAPASGHRGRGPDAGVIPPRPNASPPAVAMPLPPAPPVRPGAPASIALDPPPG
ncbi:MAG: SWIM zinc finger family protein, partial [Candidatus Dormibacteraceae bacterium]